MKQSNFTKLIAVVNALAEAKKKQASVKAELAHQSTAIIREMQQKVNRRILAVAIADAHQMSDAGQADKLFHTVWKQIDANMVDAHDLRVRAGAMVNLIVDVQEAPSPLVLRTGDAGVFTPIHSVAELERVLRSEMPLVEQLYKQGLNIKAASGLTHALQELSVELLNAWEERAWALGALISKRPQSKGFQHLTWINGQPINTYEYSGLQAVKAACDGNDPKPGDLVSGCKSLVPFLVNASLQHGDLAAIESEKFWIIDGHVNRSPIDSAGRRDYYPGEADVVVRQPWFGQKAVRPDEDIVLQEVAEARNSCQELADSAMELAVALDKALGRKADYYSVGDDNYRLNTAEKEMLEGATNNFVVLYKRSKNRLVAAAAKREEAFAAKRAGVALAEARDSRESWEVAAAGCNASQMAQLRKLRKEMGFDEGAEILADQTEESTGPENKPEPSPAIQVSIRKTREERRKAAALKDIIAEIKLQLSEAS